jgi:NADH dehydrogenase
MTVSADDVRKLLQADDDSLLVVIEGRTEVITTDALDTDAFRGALEVISKSALLARTDGATELSEAELSAQATSLDTAVSELGG